MRCSWTGGGRRNSRTYGPCFSIGSTFTAPAGSNVIVIAPQRSQAFVVRSKAWLASHGRAIAVAGLAVLGLLLVAHGLIVIC